jgi:hypothetical protein
MKRRVAVSFVIAGLVLNGCGDDGEASAGDVERYCELVEQIEVEFSALDIGADATPQDVGTREARVHSCSPGRFR